MRLTFILAALTLAPILAPILAPGPLLAQSRTFAVPQGCTAYLTIQSRECSVSHHFTCEGDPEGWQRRVDMDEDGVTYFGAIDFETQWMESTHVLAGHSERLEDSPADRASFSALLSKGIDTYDFQTISPEIGVQRFIGQDRLTGETEVIDGVTLDVTTYAIRALDANGVEMWRAEGREYISRDFRMFMSGVSTITTSGESWERNGTPMEFIFPGEPGFLSVSPIHDCGAVISALPVPLVDHAPS
jgi:hypothetical protein